MTSDALACSVTRQLASSASSPSNVRVRRRPRVVDRRSCRSPIARRRPGRPDWWLRFWCIPCRPRHGTEAVTHLGKQSQCLFGRHLGESLPLSAMCPPRGYATRPGRPLYAAQDAAIPPAACRRPIRYGEDGNGIDTFTDPANHHTIALWPAPPTSAPWRRQGSLPAEGVPVHGSRYCAPLSSNIRHTCSGLAWLAIHGRRRHSDDRDRHTPLVRVPELHRVAVSLATVPVRLRLKRYHCTTPPFPRHRLPNVDLDGLDLTARPRLVLPIELDHARNSRFAMTSSSAPAVREAAPR